MPLLRFVEELFLFTVPLLRFVEELPLFTVPLPRFVEELPLFTVPLLLVVVVVPLLTVPLLFPDVVLFRIVVVVPARFTWVVLAADLTSVLLLTVPACCTLASVRVVLFTLASRELRYVVLGP